MKVKTQYICEICHRAYDTEEAALKCESRGVPQPVPHLVGTIWAYRDNDIILALPPIYGSELTLPRDSAHALEEAFWATRPDMDTLGPCYCGGNCFHPRRLLTIKAYRTEYGFLAASREALRMIHYLRSQNIVPKHVNMAGELVEIPCPTSSN